MRMLKKALFGTWLAAMAFGAQAATISLDPVSKSANSGGTVTFDVVADIGTTSSPVSVLAGAIDFTWNSTVMTYGSFAFDASLAPPVRDSSFDINDLQSAGLVSIGFGNFSGISFSGLKTIGTLTFNVVGSPGSNTTIGLSDSSKWGGFSDTSSQPIPIVYSGAMLNVSAVPVPGALWLLISGLSCLGLVSRGRKVVND